MIYFFWFAKIYSIPHVISRNIQNMEIIKSQTNLENCIFRPFFHKCSLSHTDKRRCHIFPFRIFSMAYVFGCIFNNSGIKNSQSSSFLIKNMSIIINDFGGLGIFIGLLIMSWILKSKKQLIQYFNNTVWKFQDFSVIQILCEIIFRESRS